MKTTLYGGPTIIGVATRNTTYEELPKPLKAAIRQFPYLGNLCVPVSGLAAALAQINRKQGSIYNLYNQALADSAIIQKGEN